MRSTSARICRKQKDRLYIQIIVTTTNEHKHAPPLFNKDNTTSSDYSTANTILPLMANLPILSR